MEMSLASVDQADTLLLEYVSDGVAVVQDGAIKSANHGLAEITGYDERELTGCPLMDLVHPDDRQAVVEHRFRQLTGKEVSSLHRFRIVDRSGQSRWVEAKELPANWQGKPAVVHILTNVTRLLRAEQELNESERRYRLLAENVSDVIWVTDPESEANLPQPICQSTAGIQC